MKPMLAHTAEPDQIKSGRFINNDAWLLQPKVDGDRRLVELDGAGGYTVLNREGTASFLPPEILRVLTRLNLPMVLDGELLGGVLFIWDTPRFAGQINERTRCLDRCAAAYGLANTIGSPLIRAVPTAFDAEGKLAMIAHVLAGDGEGVMAKLCASRYEPGRRSISWRKVKTMHEIDCVVGWLGDEKANMGVYVYDGDRQVPVGEVGRRTADGELVAVGDVVKVRVVSVSEDNRLVQPTTPKLRTDKPATSCTIDQLDTARTNRNLLLNWNAA